MLFKYMKIKKNDTVKILIGKDKGKEGKVEVTYPDRNQVLIPGINEFKRHVKSRGQGEKSEITTITKPILASKVALVCPKCKKTTRVGFVLNKTGEKVRVCRKCKKEIE